MHGERPLPCPTALAALLICTGSCGSESPPTLRGELAPFVQALRPDQPGYGDSFRFDVGDDVLTFDSAGGGFRMHYAVAGRNAVPGGDANANGVPDFIEDAATTYDAVLAFYRDILGFAPPLSDAGLTDNGGDARFDVYFVDFGGGGADGAFRTDTCLASNPEQCIGYMVQENDFVGYVGFGGYPSTHVANETLASHEFFHAVQAAYDVNQGSILSEGTATWASEQFDPTLGDFDAQIAGYLDNPDHPLDVPMAGAIDPFSYGSALFFEFMSEHVGANVVRALWERVVDGTDGDADPTWFAVLPEVMAAAGAPSFAESWVEFATWNLYTGMFADPTKSYARGAGFPSVHVESMITPWQTASVRVAHAAANYYTLAPAGRAEMTAALVGSESELADMEVILAVSSGSRYDSALVLSDVTAGTETLPTTSARALVVVLVNTSTGTTSRHPGVCVGTVVEVQACREALAPPVTVPPTSEGTKKSGCSCATTSGGPAMLLGLGLVCSARRRLNRSSR